MNDVQMLSQYYKVTEKEIEQFEDTVEKIFAEEFIEPNKAKECLAFYVLKSYLLENKLI